MFHLSPNPRPPEAVGWVTPGQAVDSSAARRVLELLRDGEQCVCDLQSALQAAQSRLSFHLRVLKDAGLVHDRRDGRWSYYALRPDALTEAHDIVHALATAGPVSAQPLAALGRCCG